METKNPLISETITIVEGTYYLFFNNHYKGKTMNTALMWHADEKVLRKPADAKR